MEWENRSVSDIVPSVTGKGKGKAKAAVKTHQQLVLARRGKPELSMNFFFFFLLERLLFFQRELQEWLLASFIPKPPPWDSENLAQI